MGELPMCTCRTAPRCTAEAKCPRAAEDSARTHAIVAARAKAEAHTREWWATYRAALPEAMREAVDGVRELPFPEVEVGHLIAPLRRKQQAELAHQLAAAQADAAHGPLGEGETDA